MIVAMAILGVAVKSFRNFGKGLAEHCKCAFDFLCEVVVAFQQKKLGNRKHVSIKMMSWPGLLEAWLALTSVKYHGNL